ncbi:MAG TPA: phosphodiester glycosidase family protein [Mycobacteriales bacterium]|nr:phosphodiester glycosidase family protein [Mycobacteriales bacterium]
MEAHRIHLKSPARAAAVLACAALGVGLTLAPVTAHAAGGRWGGGSCPAAETLVSGTTWHTHKLAPGVTLSEGNRTDQNGRGLVKMHVLRIVVGKPGVSFHPLMHAVAQRTVLSKLAANHASLVAAVNTGYFDFTTGAPTQPLIVKGSPMVISSRHQRVLGFDASGALQTGKVHLAATLFDGKQTRGVTGINEVEGNGGLQAYNPAWGGKAIPAGWQALARSVVANKLGSSAGRNAHVPQGGYELMAQGTSATHWLSGLSSGSKAGIAGKVRTTTKRPFVQAYGVGAEVVKHFGKTRTNLSCDSANTDQPARTAYGIADDGKILVIGEVEDHPGTSVHGLDENQMSGFMAQLGVDRAFDVDGSGSTELLAKMPGTSTLKLRTYPADGEERALPVGLGISYKAPKVKKHHHKKKK